MKSSVLQQAFNFLKVLFENNRRFAWMGEKEITLVALLSALCFVSAWAADYLPAPRMTFLEIKPASKTC